MFTGIITDIGSVASRDGGRFQIASNYQAASVEVGCSMACDGVCLTVTGVEQNGDGCRFSVDVSNETCSKTTLDEWQPGRCINLERSATLGSEMGGHVVLGHVDGLVSIVDIQQDGESSRFSFEAPEHLSLYIAPKGSIALDGTSLTVNEVSANRFGVNLIPHSLQVTTWGEKKVGDQVNLEVDVFARYVARLMEFRQ